MKKENYNPEKEIEKFCEKHKISIDLTPERVIEVLLRERNLKKSELASMIGLQRQSLNHYLHGFWKIPTSIKLKISQALEVDSAVIWDLEDKR